MASKYLQQNVVVTSEGRMFIWIGYADCREASEDQAAEDVSARLRDMERVWSVVAMPLTTTRPNIVEVSIPDY